MSLILSHPTGNSFVRAAAQGLMEANLLAEFYTTIATFPNSFIDKIGGINAFSEIRRRRFDPCLKAITHTSPFLEAGRLLAAKAGFKKLSKHETGVFSIDAIYQHLDKVVASNIQNLSTRQIAGVYGYEDGALNSFITAKRNGLQTFYDLPIGYWRTARKLLESEKERWPDWVVTLTGFKDSNDKLKRKDEEIRFADRIFVASHFTAKTLYDFEGDLAPVEVIPYGFPPVITKREYLTIAGRPLKLLFVGGLSQRKGIAELFGAVENLQKYIQLTVIGHKVTNECRPLNAALLKHRWIPSLPNEQILQLMQEHDVLMFPSLFEGFGLVITEAMSQGTPVITTNRTAGPDLIVHGSNGWLVEAGSTKALQETLEHLLNKPDCIAEAGLKAMEAARIRPWKVYGRELANAIMNHLSKIVS